MKNNKLCNTLLTVEQLEEIKKNLPFGAQNLLAEKFGYSNAYISKVLKGTRNNDLILGEALKIAEKTRKNNKVKKRSFQRLFKKLTA